MNGANRFSWRHLLPAAAVALFLTACGGGGGGGGSNPPTNDSSPDAFSFSPAHVDDAAPGGVYTATATVTGFNGELTARITNDAGNASQALLVDGEAVQETTVSSGDTLTLQMTLGEDNPPGSTASATVTVGEGSDAKSATFTVSVPADSEGPEVGITFPTPNSITQDEAITLSGTWSDNSGEIENLVLVHNGQQLGALPPHAIFEDGTWQINVTLVAGHNELAVSAIDGAGVTGDAVTVTVTRESTLFSTPKSSTFVPESPLMYVLQEVGGRTDIIAVDTTDGFVLPVASSADASAPAGEHFTGRLLLDDSGAELLVLDVGDAGNNRLVSINVNTGQRTEIVSGFVNAITMERIDENTVYILGKLAANSAKAPAILEVKLTEKSLREFSRPGPDTDRIGGGTQMWFSPSDIGYNNQTHTLYVIDQNASYGAPGIRGLFSVNTSGDRAPIDYANPGAEVLHHPVALTVDSGANRVYIVNGEDYTHAGSSVRRGIIAYDPNAADPLDLARTNINVDGYVNLTTPVAVALVGSEVRIVDEDHPQGVVSYDLSSGSAFSRPGELVPEPAEVSPVGEGPAFVNVERILLDQANDRLLVSDGGAVRSVNLYNGNRSRDLFDPASAAIGGAHIHDGLLYFSANLETGTEIGTISLDKLNEDSPPTGYNIVVGPRDAFGRGVFADADAIYTATFDEGGKILRAHPRNGGDPSLIATVHTDYDEEDYSYFFRYDENLLLHADSYGVHSVDPAALRATALYTANTAARGYAYDAKNHKLYGLGDLGENDNLFLVDLVTLDLPEGEEAPVYPVATETTGVVMETDDLQALAFDPARDRLYAFNRITGEIVAINVMEVAVDEDGEDGFDRDQNGDLIRKTVAQATIISRALAPNPE